MEGGLDVPTPSVGKPSRIMTSAFGLGPNQPRHTMALRTSRASWYNIAWAGPLDDWVGLQRTGRGTGRHRYRGSLYSYNAPTAPTEESLDDHGVRRFTAHETRYATLIKCRILSDGQAGQGRKRKGAKGFAPRL